MSNNTSRLGGKPKVIQISITIYLKLPDDNSEHNSAFGGLNDLNANLGFILLEIIYRHLFR